MNWRHWLPTSQQMSNAAQMRRGSYTGITMQQALGMVVLMALLAGLLPFITNWFLAIRYDTVVPLAHAARNSVRIQSTLDSIFIGVPGLDHAAITDFYLTAAGLDQPLPVWLAAGLSALGKWLTWPIRWLMLWIVYGALVMIANRALGATMTLQRFYAATGFAAVPLLLLGLSPINCLGPLAALVGIVWSVAVYVRANQEVTHLPPLRAAAGVLLPAAVLIMVMLLALGIVLISSLLWAL